MKFQDDISYMNTYIHTDKPKPICPPLFQSWGHNKSAFADFYYFPLLLHYFVINEIPEDQWSYKRSPDYFPGITTTVKREKGATSIF